MYGQESCQAFDLHCLYMLLVLSNQRKPEQGTMTSSSSSATTAGASAAPVSSSSTSAGGSPCAACKFLRRKCQPDCVFAPYFSPDQPQKFARVHKVFGASNVTKLLSELTPFQREDAVNSLAYEAEMRLRDPVYGCVGVISLLHHQLRQLQLDLSCARSEISRYRALSAVPGQGLVSLRSSNQQLQYPSGNMLGIGVGRPEQLFFAGPGRDHQQQLQQQHQYYYHYSSSSSNMMARGYDAEVAAERMWESGGPCDAGLMAAMSMSAGLGALGSTNPFPRARAAGADEGQAIGP